MRFLLFLVEPMPCEASGDAAAGEEGDPAERHLGSQLIAHRISNDPGKVMDLGMLRHGLSLEPIPGTT